MTLKELIMKTSFDDILPYLERHETAHRDNLYAFREAYDILKNMKPNRDYHEKATIECHVRPDGSKYVRVLFLDDDVWENELAKQLILPDNTPLIPEELAMYCLWEITFYGFSPADRDENFREMFDKKQPANCYEYALDKLRKSIWKRQTPRRLRSKGENGEPKKIGIHEIHMEEDAGKLVHDEWDDTSLVDYNRSGVPLVEIVSEPDMRSSDEVIAYLEKLRMTAQYLGVSDCKLQEGSMRADVNLSVRRAGTEELGTRTEMKNLNSFKAIAHAIEGERARQIELLEAGKEVVQETRRWDDNKESSYAMRSKEDAQDYRYFPEPDLVPVVISDEWIREVKARQPELRPEKLERYSREFDIPRYDAELITESKKVADLFEKTVELCGKPKKVSNWIMGEMFRLMKERGMEAEELAFSPENLAKLIDLADTGTISSSVAKKVFEKIFTDNVDPEKYVEEQGLKTVNDEGALRAAVEKVLADNPQAVADYKGGKQKAFGALMGQSMRAMKGKADPASVTKMIKELLEKQ